MASSKNTEALIKDYIASLPAPKAADLEALHRQILGQWPACKLWFLDGKNSEGKVVSNPNIGYGQRTMAYADGSSRAFYRVGISANTSGISVYIMGLADKAHLANTYGKRLGKATITGYCIKFKKLQDIELPVLDEAIRDGFDAP
jgi:hypothetical protein